MSAWVEVNEARIHATTKGADWWFWYRSMADRSIRPPEVLRSSIGGDIVLLERLTLKDAEWLADYMGSRGVPASAIRVTQRKPS